MTTDNIILVDLIGEIVDSMRETGIITSSSEVSGRYTIVSDNTFKDREVVNIDSVDYIVYDPIATQFEIEAITGLDFAGLEWKALAPYYLHGHPIEISNRLNQQNSGIYQYQKYPLVALLQDFDEEIDPDKSAVYSEANPNIVIINKTDENINVDDRYDLNFRTILYPIYNNFLRAINSSKWFITNDSNSVFRHRRREAPYYGSEEDNGNTANKLSDPLDAIKITDTILIIRDNRCNFFNR